MLGSQYHVVKVDVSLFFFFLENVTCVKLGDRSVDSNSLQTVADTIDISRNEVDGDDHLDNTDSELNH